MSELCSSSSQPVHRLKTVMNCIVEVRENPGVTENGKRIGKFVPIILIYHGGNKFLLDGFCVPAAKGGCHASMD